MSTYITRAGKGSALTHTELDTRAKLGAQTKATVYTIAESDNRDTIEYSGAGTEAFTLPDAATVVAAADTGDFEVTVNHVGTGTLTIDRTTGADTIDGTAADITLQPNEAKTLKVNQAGDGYLIVTSKLSLLDEDDMASDSAIDAATQQSIKAYVDNKMVILDTPVNKVTSVSTTDSASPTTVSISGQTGGDTAIVAILRVDALITDSSGSSTACKVRIAKQGVTLSARHIASHVECKPSGATGRVAEMNTVHVNLDASQQFDYDIAFSGSTPPTTASVEIELIGYYI